MQRPLRIVECHKETVNEHNVLVPSDGCSILPPYQQTLFGRNCVVVSCVHDRAQNKSSFYRLQNTIW